jgi:hypothetical protein
MATMLDGARVEALAAVAKCLSGPRGPGTLARDHEIEPVEAPD